MKFTDQADTAIKTHTPYTYVCLCIIYVYKYKFMTPRACKLNI